MAALTPVKHAIHHRPEYRRIERPWPLDPTDDMPVPMPADDTLLPLVYSCSGCSSAAQLANALALRLDRAGIAEMSCIAGIGGNVPALLRRARDAAAAGRPIVAIDGCALACARACLAERALAPTLHLQLAEQGVRKTYRADFDPLQADELFDALARKLGALPAAVGG
jgi:uncharacterized metal-binding protein